MTAHNILSFRRLKCAVKCVVTAYDEEIKRLAKERKDEKQVWRRHSLQAQMTCRDPHSMQLARAPADHPNLVTPA